MLYVRVRGIKVINLQRKNHFAMIISRKVRQKTKVTHQLAGEEEVTIPPLILNPDALLLEIEQLERQHERMKMLLRRLKFRHLPVVYEDLVKDMVNFEPVLQALELHPNDGIPKSKMVKLIRQDYSEFIENFAKVERAISGVRYALIID